MKSSFFLITGVLFLISMNGCKKDAGSGGGTDQSTWKFLSPMPTERYSFGLVAYNHLFYAIGGYNTNGSNAVEVYDPANDKWQTKANMPTARGYLVVAVVSDKIYAIGGITGSDLNNITYTNVTEEYDPATDKWSTKSPFPMSTAVNTVIGNQFIAGAAINGKIYVVAGSVGDNTNFVYDPAADSWTTTVNPVPEFNLLPYFSATNGNDMYVTNGTNFMKYNPSSDHWSLLDPFSIPRMNSSLAADVSNVYSIGGFNIANNGGNATVTNSDKVQAYNLLTAKWDTAVSLNIKRHSSSAIIDNNILYVLGGAQKESNFTDVALSSMESLILK